jgi:tRNA threonylcarbamoyladenosine dehydratase
MDFACVYSTEPLAHLPPAALDAPAEPNPVERGRPRRVLGSLPTVTGIFGLTAANVALRMLLGECFPSVTPL